MNILVTGGAGFIGCNLIKNLVNDENNKITSLDNYFTGKIENEVDGVEYIRGNTWDAENLLEGKRFDIVYHFGEYSRIAYSFDDIKILHDSFLRGTPVILELCRKWEAKLIYSATSSSLGNGGMDQNLSPYAWMKSKIIELIKNYSKWFGLKYQICYFFNVYGPSQIDSGKYSTVVGIFYRQYKNGQKCTVVSPGTQKRDFTHVFDVVNGLIKSSHIEYNYEWFLRSKKCISIIELANMFGEYEIIPERKGERFTAEYFETDTETKLNWRPVHDIEEYITQIKKAGNIIS